MNKKAVKKIFDGLKKEMGTVEEIKKGFRDKGKLKEAIDETEEAFQMYIKYLRYNTNKEGSNE